VSDAAPHVSERAATLRREFDRAFAEPFRADTSAREDLLGIRAGAQAYAIRLSEIAGLHADKKITRVPGSAAALCGIAGFRGALLPVYDLLALLGQPAGTATPRWLVIAQAAPVALAFEAFEGHLRASRDEIVAHTARSEAPRHARELLRMHDFIGPILHLPSVLDAIKALRTPAVPTEE
jgi:chemotaxis signal transduction protein